MQCSKDTYNIDSFGMSDCMEDCHYVISFVVQEVELRSYELKLVKLQNCRCLRSLQMPSHPSQVATAKAEADCTEMQ